jgi:hypothetical protein
MLYNRHGQSAACGPHAARQTFFAALELRGGSIFFGKCTPLNAIFEVNVEFLSQKMTFLKKNFGTFYDSS